MSNLTLTSFCIQVMWQKIGPYLFLLLVDFNQNSFFFFGNQDAMLLLCSQLLCSKTGVSDNPLTGSVCQPGKALLLLILLLLVLSRIGQRQPRGADEQD